MPTIGEDVVALHRPAYELRQTEFGISDKRTRAAGAELVLVLIGHNAQAAIDVAHEVLDNTPPHESNTFLVFDLRRYIAAANSRFGDHESAFTELRDVLDSAQKSLLPNHLFLVEAKASLALALRKRAHFGKSDSPENDRAEAIALFQDALVQSQNVRGDDDINTLNIMLNLVNALKDAKQNEEAEQLAMQVLETAPSRLGPDQHFCVPATAQLAFIVFERGNYQKAAVYSVDALEMIRRRPNEIGIELLSSIGDALPILEAGGKFQIAEEYVNMMLKKMGSQHGDMALRNQIYLARFLSGQGKMAAAQEVFKSVLESGNLKNNPSNACLFKLFWGEHKLDSGDYDLAMSLFKQSLDESTMLGPSSYPTTARIKNAIIRAEN